MTNIPTENINQLLFFFTCNVRFKITNHIYHQNECAAMGYPNDSLLADIFIIKLESRPIEPSIHTIYFENVDDMFCVPKPSTRIDQLLNRSTWIHPHLKFTMDLFDPGRTIESSRRQFSSAISTQRNHVEWTVHPLPQPYVS